MPITALLLLVDLLLSVIVTSLLTWALTDIYFYSAVFDPVREYSKRALAAAEKGQWDPKRNRLFYLFLYALGCPFCISHWFAAFSAVLVGVNTGTTPLTLLIVIPIAARLANTISDFVLPPVTNTVLDGIMPQPKTEPQDVQENPDTAAKTGKGTDTFTYPSGDDPQSF
jgi:hypothetical protein